MTAMSQLQSAVSQLQTDLAELKASNQRKGIIYKAFTEESSMQS